MGFVGSVELAQEAVAVRSRVLRQWLADYLGKGGEEVGQANGRLVAAVRGDMAGPAGEERYPVTGFPNIGLGAAKGTVCPVMIGIVRLYGGIAEVIFVTFLGIHEGPVVAGEDHEGALGQLEFIEGLEHLAHAIVDVHDEVAVGTKLGLPLEAWMRDHGLVRAG